MESWISLPSLKATVELLVWLFYRKCEIWNLWTARSPLGVPAPIPSHHLLAKLCLLYWYALEIHGTEVYDVWGYFHYGVVKWHGCLLCSNTFHSCEFGLTAELLYSLNNINDPLALLQWHHNVCSILKLEYVVQWFVVNNVRCRHNNNNNIFISTCQEILSPDRYL